MGRPASRPRSPDGRRRPPRWAPAGAARSPIAARGRRARSVSILSSQAAWRIDHVGDPAGQHQAARGDRLGRQQGVAEQPSRRPTTSTTGRSSCRARSARVEAIATAARGNRRRLRPPPRRRRRPAVVAATDRLRVDAHAFHGGGDMRRGRLAQQIRAWSAPAGTLRRGGAQCSASSLCKAPSRSSAPAATGFMPAARTPCRQRMQQGGGDQGLADFGVGAGDEAAAAACRAAVAVQCWAQDSAGPAHRLELASCVGVRGDSVDAQARSAGGTVGGRIAGTHRPYCSAGRRRISASLVVRRSTTGWIAVVDGSGAASGGSTLQSRAQLARSAACSCARRARAFVRRRSAPGWPAAHAPGPAAPPSCRCRAARAAPASRSRCAWAATKAPPTPAALPSVPM